MSETKRVTLTPISASKKDQKKVKEVSKSFRFKLTLSESNDCTYPEFNYRELLNSAEEKIVCNGDSFPDDDDEDVKRIAREMEAKYGHGPPKKKKKRFNSYDYADVGAGYDESDSFIDNTDAYDEVVPPEMSTLYGGFYINCGRLEFKQQELSETEEPDESVRSTGKNRKRILESDSDEDSDGDNKGKCIQSDKKPRLDSDVEKSKKKQEDLTALLSKKKKTLTVKDLLREKRIDCINTNGEEVKVPTNHTSVNDVIESVINANSAVQNIDDSSKESGTTTTTITSIETISSSDEKEEKKDNKKDVVSVTLNNSDIPKLPEKLSDELKNLLETIKKSVSSSEGKKKFLSDSVNSSLIKLHNQCRVLGNNIRNQVYAHLATFVNCKKETLIRRTKKLLLEEDQSKLKSSLKRLKDCINMVMPVLLENYVQECQRVNEKRLAQDTKEMVNGEKPKSMRFPKRRFQWTEDSRQILGEIIVIRRKMDHTRKEKFETCLEEFYKKEIVQLWPEGWISVNSLMRETQPFLETFEKKINNENKKCTSSTDTPVLKSNSTATNSTTTNSLNDKKSDVAVSVTNKMVENVSVPSQTKVSSKNSVKSESSSNPAKIENSSTIKIDDPVKEDCSLKMENGSSVKIDDSVSIIKKINNSNSSLTIEAIPLSIHKTDTLDSKEKSNKNENKLDADSIKIPSCSTITVMKGNSKGNSRNNSPIPNAPIDLNIKSQNNKISVRNISDLSDLSKIVEKSVNNEKKNQQTNDSDIEIIEIKDDVLTALKEKKNNKIDVTESDKLDKVRTKHKKKHKPPGAKLDVEELVHDMFSQIITKQLGNSGYAQKNNPDEVQKSGKPENDVEQVMKDLQELHELSGSSREKDGEKTSQPTSSPVSVIAVNSTKYSTVKCKSEIAGFQDAFQKHLLQEVKDCNNTKVSTNKSNSTSSSSTTQQKVKFANNSKEIFPFLGNLTTLPVSTSQRFPQNNITLNSNVTEQQQSQPGAVSKNIDDVILFPNFIYEFGLNKLKGPVERKSPPH